MSTAMHAAPPERPAIATLAGAVGGGTAGQAARRVAVVAVAVAAAVVGSQMALLPLLLVALLAGVIVAARPDAGALVAVGLLYSNAVVVVVHHHGVPGAAAAVVPLLFLISISYRVFACREPLLLPRAGLWVVALLVVQLVGAVSSRDPVESVASLQTFIVEGLLLFVLVTNAIRGYELVRLAALTIVVVAALLGALSAVQDLSGGGDYGGFATTSKAVVGEDATGGGARRHAGPIGEQNRWAQSLAIVLPLAVALSIADRRRAARFVARVSAVGILTGLVLTYSRGAVVGLLLTGLVAVLLRWVRVKVALAVLAITVVGLGALAPVFVNRASTVVNARTSVSGSKDRNANVDGSIANRTTEANAAVAVFLHHPVIGVGVGLFPTYFQDEARRQGADRIVGVNREAHDLYLGIAAETGLAGLVAFTGLIGALLGPLASVRRHHLGRRDDVAGLAAGFFLAVVTYLTTGIFLHFAYIRYFWLLVGLAAAMGLVRIAVPEPTPPPTPLPGDQRRSGAPVPATTTGEA